MQYISHTEVCLENVSRLCSDKFLVIYSWYTYIHNTFMCHAKENIYYKIYIISYMLKNFIFTYNCKCRFILKILIVDGQIQYIWSELLRQICEKGIAFPQANMLVRLLQLLFKLFFRKSIMQDMFLLIF